MPVVLDIETVPLAESLAAEYPEDRQPPANYKSAETIAKWREQDRIKWVEERAKKASLNPRLGRILCLGWAVVTKDEGTLTDHGCFYAEHEEGEKELLANFWRLMATHSGQVVTWNGSWDLRFIVLRSAHHRLTPSLGGAHIREWLRKYQTRPHFDCKAVVLNWDVVQSGEGLSEWAAFFGLPGKTEGVTGKDVYPLFLGGMHDEIAEYCIRDVLATAGIYAQLLDFFGDTYALFDEA